MMKPMDSCCCGCSLRTGSLIIGVVSTISTLIVLTIAVFALAAVIQSENKSLEDDIPVPESDLGKALSNIYPIVEAWLSNFILITVLELGFHLSLIVASCKEQTKPLLGWLLMSLVVLVIYTLEIFQSTVEAALDPYASSPLPIVGAGLIYAAVRMFFMLVIYSYYQELRRGQQMAYKNAI